MPDASFGSPALGMFLFSFFRVLYILTNGFLFYLGCIYVLQAREGFGWTAMTKTGPNNARHVVWALGIYLNLCKCMQPVAVPMVYPWCTHMRSMAQTTPDTSFGPLLHSKWKGIK